MRKRDIEFVEKVGSRRTVSLTLTDDVGTVIDLSSTTTYNSGKWKVWKPDGTLIIDGLLPLLTGLMVLFLMILLPPIPYWQTQECGKERLRY